MLKVIKYIRSRKPDINIWVYTGFLFEDISHLPVLREIDVLVDGKFILEEKDISLKFRGSANQRVVDIKKSLQNNKELLCYNVCCRINEMKEGVRLK